MYSLVSAAVMAQDLLRHPYAVRVSEAVDRVLALGEDDLARLGRPAPAAVRARVLSACRPPARPASDRLRAGGTGGSAAPERAVDVLDGAMLGCLDDLHRLLVREEPLRGAPPEAVQVALDAVTAAWAGVAAALPDTGALLRPWEQALPEVGPPLAVGGPALRDLLDAVTRRSPEQWQRTAAAHVARRGSGPGWGTAMHEACRLAWEHGRLREVARAQLASVRALALTGAAPVPSAVAMAVTSAVQALCTADLLPPGTRQALLAGWEAGE